jgi:hypothetical protein
MKINKGYLIAGIIIALSVVYLLLRSDAKINYEIPRFTSFEKDDIVSVSISGPDGDLELKKSGDSWIIEPRGDFADVSLVNNLLSQSSDLSIVDLISPGEDYRRYELDDSSALSVSLFTKDGPVREFLLGKSSATSIYSYIRLKEKKGVYSVRGNLKSTFISAPDKWRDKQVLSFDPDSVVSIEIQKDGNTVLLSSKSEDETRKWYSGGVSLDNSDDIEVHVKSLSKLKCLSYLDDSSPDPLASVKITTAGGVHTLDLLEKLDQGYSARTSYVNDPFMIPLYMGDMILGF